MIKILHTGDIHLGDLAGPTKDGQNLRRADTIRCMQEVYYRRSRRGEERKRMKNVQIPYDLFVALVEYHLGYDDEYEDEIRQGLEQKLDALVRHELYAKYKTAPSPEEREQARQAYLDRRGVFPDFRW